jgi:integrase
MPHLSPQTLTEAEQRRLRRATAAHPRDHLIFSLALGTGLRPSD